MKPLAVFAALMVVGVALARSASAPGSARDPRAESGGPPDSRFSDSLNDSRISQSNEVFGEPPKTARQRRALPETFSALGLRFETNCGQANADMNFVARGRNHVISLSPNGAQIDLLPSPREDASSEFGPSHLISPRVGSGKIRTVRMNLLGANPAARVSGVEPLSARVHYFTGDDPAAWRRDVPTFIKTRFEETYVGIAVVYYGRERELEFDFEVAPGANPDVIALQFDGADSVRVDAQGDLCLRVGREELRFHRPVAYQEIGGKRRDIAARFRLKRDRVVRFALSAYDRSAPLTIDPVLAYATYLGGGKTDIGWDIAVTPSGSAVIVGETLGLRSPGPTPGARQSRFGGGTAAGGDAFVAKLTPDGALQFLTYLGGRGNDAALGVALDAAGDIYVTGYTDSPNFPRTNAVPGGNRIHGQPHDILGTYPLEAFVTKLDAGGSNLIYSTFLGGNRRDFATSIAVDATGSAYVTGLTESTNFPAFPPLPTTDPFGCGVITSVTNRGGGDAFLTKIHPAGSNVIYSTFVGGTGRDQGLGVAVDAAGQPIMVGFAGFTNPVPPALNFVRNGFGLKFTSNGTDFVSCFHFDTAGTNIAYRVRTDAAGFAYVVGSKMGEDFPITPGFNPGGVFRSADGATTWLPGVSGLSHPSVQALALTPTQPDTIYAGTPRGLFQSVDGGMNWARRSGPLRLRAVTAIAVPPANANTVYLGAADGVFKSVDAGATWTTNRAGMGSASVTVLAISPADASTLFAGTRAGVFRSTDAAASWHSASAGLGEAAINALALDPLAPSTLYVAHNRGVSKSANGGTNWISMNLGLTNPVGKALAIHPTQPQTLYLGTTRGVFKSTDGAASWTPASAGLGNSNITALALDPRAPNTLYAGTTNGLFKSTDGGASWTTNHSGLSALNIGSVAVEASGAGRLFVGLRAVTSAGDLDVFLAKIGPDGPNFVYSLALGGHRRDEGWDIAVDPAGNAYITGITTSTNFPIVAPASARQSTNSGRTDAFVAAFDPTGTSLLYSMYFGGRNHDFAYGIDVDATGNAYVIGRTASVNLPTTEGAMQPRFGGGPGDAFIAKIVSSPVLRVTARANELTLSWQAEPDAYELETSDTLGGPWQRIAGTPVSNGPRCIVTLPAGGPCRFFRLRPR